MLVVGFSLLPAVLRETAHVAKVTLEKLRPYLWNGAALCSTACFAERLIMLQESDVRGRKHI